MRQRIGFAKSVINPEQMAEVTAALAQRVHDCEQRRPEAFIQSCFLAAMKLAMNAYPVPAPFAVSSQTNQMQRYATKTALGE